MSVCSVNGKLRFCFRAFCRRKSSIIWISFIGISLLICVGSFSHHKSTSPETVSGYATNGESELKADDVQFTSLQDNGTDRESESKIGDVQSTVLKDNGTEPKVDGVQSTILKDYGTNREVEPKINDAQSAVMRDYGTNQDREPKTDVVQSTIMKDHVTNREAEPKIDDLQTTVLRNYGTNRESESKVDDVQSTISSDYGTNRESKQKVDDKTSTSQLTSTDVPHKGSADVKDKNMSDSLEPLTLHCNLGRLGNQMCTLAVLKGLGALNHREISMLPCNKKILDPYFELNESEINLTTFLESTPHKIGFYLRPEDSKISNQTNIIKGYYYPCSFTFFDHIRQDIRKTFRFREKFISSAQQVLSNIKGNMTNATFVGVHIRRSDYVGRGKSNWLWAFEGREVGMEYFEKATKYFRDKYSNVIFIVVSDDLPWCRQNLKDFDMYIPETSLGRAYDMAMLTQCNHTIITYGTFGSWGGYLAGGEVVYFDNFLKPGTAFTKGEFRFDKMYLPEWIGIDTTKPGFWDTFVRPPMEQ